MPVAATKPALAVIDNKGFFCSAGQQKVVLGLLLVVGTLALYNPAAHNGFVNFDDDRYVTDNAHVRAGLQWRTVTWAFSSLDQANWHPLTWLSHALDCQLFQLNPVGHHYTSVLLHAANVLLVFLIFQWFTGHTARSLIVSALFAVHPLNVESVAWVAERKSVLSMFFFLLTLGAYGWYVRKPGTARYLSVSSLFAAALMCKPMVVTLPFVLLLLDYWPLHRTKWGRQPATGETSTWATTSLPRWKLCLEKLPLLVLSTASAAVTMIAQRGGGAVLTSAARNPVLRIENSIVSYVLYLIRTAWPFRLAALYPYPHAIAIWKVGIAAALLTAITIKLVKSGEKRYLAFGWLWFLGTMIPMLGLVQVGNQAMADRYAYLPMTGLFVIVVWAVADWATARQGSAMILVSAAVALLAALAVLTHIQLRYWHDDYALWSHTLTVTDNNFVAENNLAAALMKMGRNEEAIGHFRNAAEIEPGDSASQFNLGIYAQEHGDMRQAEARYRNALRLATDSQIRASAFANLGSVYFAQGDLSNAEQNFDSALKLNPDFSGALLEMGLIKAKTAQDAADWDRVADYFARFVQGAPSDVGYVLLSNTLRRAGHEDDAKHAYGRAIALSGDISAATRKAAELVAR